MTRIGFTGGIISVLLGVITLITTSSINEIMPKIARIVFMTTTGSYSDVDYRMNFSYVNTIAFILIIVGIIFGAYCFISENKK